MKKGMISCLAVWAVVVSETSWAAPITDIVLVDGREWAQVNLFTNNTWNTVNGQCPAGLCSRGSILNGFDLEGWTWASIYDVQALFNTYTGQTTLAPSSYGQTESTWAPAFLAAFNVTEEFGGGAFKVVRGWSSTRYDSEHSYAPFAGDTTYDQIPDRVSTDAVPFDDNDTIPSDIGTTTGAWFVRDVSQVPAPATLALLGLGLAGIWMSRIKKQAPKV